MEASFTDEESGLEWIIHTHAAMTGTWDEVKAFSEDNGDTSWRMPTIHDILTLLYTGSVVGLKHLEFSELTIWMDHQEYNNTLNYYMISFKSGDADIRRSNRQNKRNIVLVREIP